MENVRPDISWLELSPQKRKRKVPVDKAKEHRPRGRPPLESVHPSLPNTIAAIVEENGFEAHRRRQSTTGSCGLTLSSLRERVLQAEPELAETNPNLSMTALRRRLKAPNIKFNASSRYKGYVSAKVPHKRNNRRAENKNSHYYSARVRYCMEAASMLGNEAMVMSVDNKNKVKVGSTTLAVDRRLAIRRIFPTDDVPDYMDHDFPNPGYLLTPSGYMEMTHDDAAEMMKDEHGREHYKFPTPSAITVTIRGPTNKCNIESHVNDMLPLIRKRVAEGTKFLVVVSDGGPDFNPNHLVNQVYLSRLFQESGLEGMIVTTYCPGHSALNPIEHFWAPLTNALVGVYLPDFLPGESRPPCKQSGLTQQERCKKEKKVFDNAMAELAHYWKDVTFSSVKPQIKTIPCGEEQHAMWNDYNLVHNALSGPMYKLKERPEVKAELDYLSLHMDRRIGMLIFSKCEDHCHFCLGSTDAKLTAVLKDFPSPQPSPTTEGHFCTFIEAMSQQVRHDVDKDMPLVMEKNFGKCSICANFMFTSTKNKQDHKRLFHGTSN